jgi:hypothetical protein
MDLRPGVLPMQPVQGGQLAGRPVLPARHLAVGTSHAG